MFGFIYLLHFCFSSLLITIRSSYISEGRSSFLSCFVFFFFLFLFLLMRIIWDARRVVVSVDNFFLFFFLLLNLINLLYFPSKKIANSILILLFFLFFVFVFVVVAVCFSRNDLRFLMISFVCVSNNFEFKCPWNNNSFIFSLSLSLSFLCG